MFKQYEMELAGRTLRVDIGRVCAQANGAALMHYGDTVVLSTATASKEPREGIDFFPLSVEYEEKMYAAGKIPGGFNKREGKASENAILTSRVIDRPMRPLFPKDYRNDVTLNNMVMSVDENCRPELLAMIGSAIATSISDIPFDGPCATTQIGMIDGEFIVNPSQAQWQDGDLQLTVASTKQKVIMIEAGANEIPEDKMIEAIYKAHDINQTIIAFIDKIVAEVGKEKHSYVSCAVPAEMFEAMKQVVSPEEMEVAVFTDDKQTREENIRVITEKLEEAFAEKEEWLEILGEAIYQYQKKTVRKMILKDHKRPDGRRNLRSRFKPLHHDRAEQQPDTRPAAADHVADILQRRSGFAGDDTNTFGVCRQRLFVYRVKQAFLFQPGLQLLQRKLCRAQTIRKHLVYIDLKRTVPLVEGSAAAYHDPHPLLRAKRQTAGIGAEHHRLYAAGIVPQRKVAVPAAGVLHKICDLTPQGQIEQNIIHVQQIFDVPVQGRD